jgi:ribosomal protein S15P/S13E
MVCEPAFVRLETRKPYCHLWYYAGEYSAKTLVQRKRCLAAHNHGTSRDKAARFGLNMKIGRVERLKCAL